MVPCFAPVLLTTMSDTHSVKDAQVSWDVVCREKKVVIMKLLIYKIEGYVMLAVSK